MAAVHGLPCVFSADDSLGGESSRCWYRPGIDCVSRSDCDGHRADGGVMRFVWVNVYKRPNFLSTYDGFIARSPQVAKIYFDSKDLYFVRLEQRLENSSHWHRPPVGIRASDCSHY